MWHDLRTLRAEALREWTTWLGGAICAGGLVGVFFFTTEQLVEFGGRVTAMGGIVAGALLILKRAKAEP